MDFNEFSKNEFLNFFSSKDFEFDNVAKNTFKDMLNCIKSLDVIVFADYRREVKFNPKEDLDTKVEKSRDKFLGVGSEIRRGTDLKMESEEEIDIIYPTIIKNLTTLREIVKKYKVLPEHDEIEEYEKLADSSSVSVDIDPKVDLDEVDITQIDSLKTDLYKNDKNFDEVYKKLKKEWIDSQKKLKRNTKPGQGTRRRLKINAKYIILCSEWEDQRSSSSKKEKMSPVTKRRLMKIAKFWFDKTYSKLTKTTESNKISNFEEFMLEKQMSKNLNFSKIFSNIKKSIKFLVDEKEKGISINSKFIDDILVNKKTNKNSIIDLYKEIWKHLFGEYKNKLPNSKNIYESLELLEKERKIIAEKISIFYLTSKQFDKKIIFSEINSELRDKFIEEYPIIFGPDELIELLVSFNDTMKKIMDYFNQNKIVEEVQIKRWSGPKTKTVQNVNRFKTAYHLGTTEVVAMKGQSGHRLFTKLLGKTKEDYYSISINGKHFVSDAKGKEGQPLVNPKISEMYYNFLDEIGKLQEKAKRNLIDLNDYDNSLNKIKTKYQLELSNIK